MEMALHAGDLLAAEGIKARIVNMRFAKPVDGRLILESFKQSQVVFTLEEHVLTGGFGSKVLEFLEQNDVTGVTLKRIALPDEFIEHGSKDVMFDRFGLSPLKIATRVRDTLKSNHPVELTQS